MIQQQQLLHHPQQQQQQQQLMYPRVSGAQITVNHSKGLFEVKCTIHIFKNDIFDF